MELRVLSPPEIEKLHRAKAGAYSTLVDNWVYDPENGRWQRLRELPVSSGNFPSGRIA